MRTGLYFGSFNPIHTGHLIVAQHMLNTGLFDEIRFIVSPQNPFKPATDLMPEELRLSMVKAAISENSKFTVSDVEFGLPKPSYTIQTLNRFREMEADKNYSIIMGSDNLRDLHLWKSIEEIAAICSFDVYNRPGSENTICEVRAEIRRHDAPFLDISATHIRNLLNRGKSIRYLVPEVVFSILNQS